MTHRATVSTSLLVAVICLALVQLLGAALGNRELIAIGKALGFSPNPQPFHAIAGYEDFSATRQYELSYESGSTVFAPVEEQLSGGLEGPHRRKAALLVAYLWAPVLPEPVVEGVLRYSFCTEHMLAPHGMSAEGVQSVTLTVREKSGSVRSVFTAHCL